MAQCGLRRVATQLRLGLNVEPFVIPICIKGQPVREPNCDHIVLGSPTGPEGERRSIISEMELMEAGCEATFDIRVLQHKERSKHEGQLISDEVLVTILAAAGEGVRLGSGRAHRYGSFEVVELKNSSLTWLLQVETLPIMTVQICPSLLRVAPRQNATARSRQFYRCKSCRS